MVISNAKGKLGPFSTPPSRRARLLSGLHPRADGRCEGYGLMVHAPKPSSMAFSMSYVPRKEFCRSTANICFTQKRAVLRQHSGLVLFKPHGTAEYPISRSIAQCLAIGASFADGVTFCKHLCLHLNHSVPRELRMHLQTEAAACDQLVIYILSILRTETARQGFFIAVLRLVVSAGECLINQQHQSWP